MPGIRELPSSASCPNWANNRDFLTSAEDRCSGNARGEPPPELGEPSAIDMRSIGISNNCDLAPLHPVPPRVALCVRSSTNPHHPAKLAHVCISDASFGAGGDGLPQRVPLALPSSSYACCPLELPPSPNVARRTHSAAPRVTRC